MVKARTHVGDEAHVEGELAPPEAGVVEVLVLLEREAARCEGNGGIDEAIVSTAPTVQSDTSEGGRARPPTGRHDCRPR